MNIGERIKHLRKSNKISAKSFAKEIGISQVFLSYIENGTKKPSLETIEKICNAFNITLAEFFNDSTSSKPLTEDLKELVESAKDLSPEQIKAFTQAFKTITKG